MKTYLKKIMWHILYNYKYICIRLRTTNKNIVFTGRPPDEQIGSRMAKIAVKYDIDSASYFNNLKYKRRYMKPYVAYAAEYIAKHANKTDKILDVCAGPGNLGLALNIDGYYNYLATDIDRLRLAWGKYLASEYGINLKTLCADSKKLPIAGCEFDYVTLLGWEAPVQPYSYLIKECKRVLRNDGTLIFTWHDQEKIVEGNWDEEPGRTQSYLPYSISKTALYQLCKRSGVEIILDENPGWDSEIKKFFPDKHPRVFPQNIIVCRKVG